MTCARAVESGVIEENKKLALDAHVVKLNPFELRRERERLLDRLWELGRHTR